MTRTRPNFAPTALAIAISLISANLHAADLPTGGNIVGGSGSISQDGNSLNVQQNSDKLITNWDSFDIGAGNTVNFYQPGSNSVALNRVIGEDASAIYGNLNANGKVFLVNPNGVLFGEGAAVNVGALVASTLSLSDQDFNDGNYQFQGDGNNAAVINRGSITADGGAVALLGGQVSNHGIIQANQGTVALAAGDKITLDFAGDGLLNVTVDEGTIDALVENHQLVRANGGQVVMTANATNALLQTVVNNTGIIEAQTLDNQSGTIVLKGGFNGGTVNVAGTLDASAPDSGDGGFIDTSGAHVKIAGGTQVTTKANNGTTGEWLIDPTDFTISASSDALTDSGIGAATLSANLENNNVTLATVDGGTEAGDMYVNGAVSWNADHTLSLNAHNNIHINEAITATNGGLTLNAGGNISADGAVNVGTFNLQSGAWSQLVSNLADFSARDFRLNTANARFLRANGGDGSEGNAYQIVDLYGLQGMASRSLLSSHFALTNDIDASGTTNWNGGAGFVPIGNGTNNYTGSFDGQGHSINGLTINRRRTNEVGLFGVISASQISNIGLTNATITGQSRVGGLVGQGLNNSRISYSSVQGDISAYLNGGGLTGNFAGTIEHSHSAGAVYATEVSGGLVGWLVGQISDSYSTASVKGDFGGGLVGIMNGGQISRSYATGQVKEYIFGSIGGLIGSMRSGTITNSYWNTDTSGQASAAGLGSSTGTTGLTTAQMFDAANFSGFDFAGTWANANNQTTPYLRALAGNRVFNKNDLPTGTIDATNRPALYTVIQNVEQLQAMRDDVTANYLLGNHIDASATAGWNGGAGFVPVGDGANRYAGSFDGLGHTLSNLTIDRSSTDFVGLFGATASGSMIRDIGLVGGSVSGRNHVGGLVGVSSGTISNAYATDSVEGSGRVGGLVGFNQSGTLNDAYATGDVEGSSEDVGGLVGLNQSGTISNVYATGSVKGADRVGGLAGANQSGTISDAYATGSVSGREYVGGLAGYNYSTISNAYATGSIEGITFVGGLLGYNTGTINNLYATGSVKGSSFSIGGLVGYNYLATISNAYATGSVKGGDLVGGLVGSNGGTISNAYATGSVKGKNAVGGLVGYTSSGTISNAYATGSVEGSETSTGGLVGSNGGTISNAYATGSVKGSDAYVGGLVGFNRSGTINDAYATGSVSATDSAGGLVGYSFDSSTITNSYWNIDTSGKANAVGLNNSGSTNGITGLTTAQMLQADSFTGWDIDAQGGTGTVWRIYEGYTAPLLRNFLTALEVTGDTTTTTYNGTEQTGGWSTTGEYDADRIFGQASGGGRNAGTYNIDMSGLYSDQQGYDLITTNGTLTINKAQATVTANSGTTTYNGAEQSVDGFTVDGLVNGENASVLT
ncbi:beta strand repeat-containing protein, partial [Pseudomonas abyssi]